MDLDVFTFFLDVGFHLLSLVASAVELLTSLVQTQRGAGNKYMTLFYLALFTLHVLQIRLWKRHVYIRRVD